MTLPITLCWATNAQKPRTILLLLQYSLGVFLMVFNYWAKVDAHRCIGEYCWYWGDFFYAKTLDLTFDGIFELFPHPMYTVGYAGYYGYTMCTRSYTMLFTSIAAHMLQMVFLVLVEEPHIERTYGTSDEAEDRNRFIALYDRESGWFPQKKDTIGFWRASLFRATDFAVIVFAVYGVVVSSIVDKKYCVAQVVAWRLLLWVGCGSILWSQGKYQYWSRYYQDNGRSLKEGFTNWKRMYNLITTMNVVVFLGCAWRYWDLSVVQLSGWYCMCVVIGILLILLTVYSTYSIYDSVGDFGWFYGDFFITKDSLEQHLCYTGIYRFLNNPDCVTGYAYVYGLSLITQSWTLFLLSVMSHCMNLVFVVAVEMPHMRRLYGEREIRADAPMVGAVKSSAQKFLGTPPPKSSSSSFPPQFAGLKKDAQRIRDKAFSEIFNLYSEKKREAFTSDKVAGAKKSTELTAVDKHSLGKPLTVTFKTAANHSLFDWVGIYSIDTPSAPSKSKGRWLYVTEGPEKTITFPVSIQPEEQGVYELRYHLQNTYEIITSRPIIFTA